VLTHHVVSGTGRIDTPRAAPLTCQSNGVIEVLMPK
jgi:hypothetical protein